MTTRLEELRQEFPQYKNIPDDKLLSAIHDKFAADMPMEEFSRQMTAERGLWPDIKQGIQGFNQGLFGVLGLPGEAVNAVVSPPAALLESALSEQTYGQVREKQRRASERTRGVTKSLFFPDDPASNWQKFSRRVGLEVGASVPFAAAGQAAAPLVAPLARTGGNVASRVIGTMGEQMAKRPALNMWGELAAATGAGTGAGAAEHFAPDSPLAEAGGQLAGSFLPALTLVSPAMLAVRIARRYGAAPARRFVASLPEDIRAKLPFKGRLEKMAKAGEADIQSSAAEAAIKQVGKPTPEEIRNLGRAEKIMQRIPGFKPSLAERSGNQPLLNVQQQLEAKATGQELTGAIMLRERNERAVQQYGFANRPRTEETPSYVIDTAARSIDDIAAPERQALATVEQQRRGLASIPTVDRASQGETLRKSYWANRGRVSKQMDKLADDLGINAADWTANFTEWRNDMLAKFPKKELGNPRNYPDVMARIDRVGEPKEGGAAFGDVMAGKAGPQPKVVNFQELKALREWLGRARMDAMAGSNPNRQKARVIDELQAELDIFIDDVGGKQFGKDYETFRQRYFDDFIDVFENGAAFKSKQKNGRGFYVTQDEFRADLYFNPGGVSDIRQFKRVFGADPEANAALEAVALDRLRDAAVRDGTLNRSALESWIRQHRTVLDELPGLKSKVADIGQAEAALLTRQAQIQERLDMIADQKLARVVAKVRGMDMTPEQAIDRALGDPRLMRQMLASIQGDDEALGALRRHVWDNVIDKPAAVIAKFIDTNRGALRMLFNDRQLLGIRTIADAREILSQLPSPKGSVEFPRIGSGLEEALGGMTIQQLGTRGYALATGRVGKSYPLIEVTMRILRGHGQADLDAALKRAIYDPDLNADLLIAADKRAKGAGFGTATMASILRRIYPRLFTAGLTMAKPENEQVGR